MKTKKRRLETLSFYDHTGIERHLARMAQRGWMIERITNQFWTYRRIEPQRLHFSVTYYPKASDFAPGPSEGQQTFFDFCTRTGWELTCTWFQMQIFYNAAENPIPIDTDPVYEVENIHLSCKANYLRGYWMLLILGLVGTYFLISALLGHTLHFLSSPNQMMIYACGLALFLQCAVELCAYYGWHRKAVAAAEDGIFLDTPSTARFQRAILIFLAVMVLLWFVNLVFAVDPLMVVIALLVFGAIFGTQNLAAKAKEFYKRKKLPSGLNRMLTFVTAFLIGVVLMAATLTIGTVLSRSGLFDQSLRTKEPPLTVQELTEVSDAGYRTITSPGSTALLDRVTVEQRQESGEPDQSLPTLKYELYQVKVPALYDFFAGQLSRIALLDAGDGVTLTEIDPAPWGAEAAWQMTDAAGTPPNRFLLHYESRLVDLSLSWTPSPEQMALAAEKLTG